MKTCEKCGFINEDNARFCTSCGSLLPEIPEDITAIVDEVADETAPEVTEEPVYEPEIVFDEPDFELEKAVEETAIEPEIVVEEPAYEPEPEPIPEPEPEPIPVPVPAPAPAPIPAPVYAAPEAPVQTDAVNVPKKGEHTVKGRAFGIIGFIINLDALIASILPGSNFAALIYSIIGLIFCHISRNNTNFRLTKVAKVFGILALIFSIVTIVIYGLLLFLFIELLANDPQVQDFFARLFY